MRLILDLDYTLFDTNAMRTAVYNALAKVFDISFERYMHAEQQMTQNGSLYTLEAHMHALFHDAKSTQEALSIALQVVQNGDQFLYDDVKPFLQNAKQKGHECVLLTFGNTAWQKQKVDGTSLQEYIDQSVYVDTSKTDAGALFEEANVIAVNDKASEIDDLARLFPNVDFAWITRPHAPYIDTPPTAPHTDIRSFSELSL